MSAGLVYYPASHRGRATILRGDALHLALADNTVDLVVTSPPYFGLRSYQDGGEHYSGQIGDESTPAEFVDALIAVTAECMRVLKPSGSIWVNLGDKYAGSAGSSGYSDKSTLAGFTNPNTKGRQMSDHGARKIETDVRAKSLIGIPWRYALRCIDDLGLILRAEVIWSKVNGLPESVTDRVRRSHEQWFHFTMQPRYYSAVDAIREEQKYPNDQRHLRQAGGDYAPDASGHINGGLNPLGKLPSSVWELGERESVLRSVLSAIHTGNLTIDEGERILTGAAQWTGSHDSGARSTSPAIAGSGLLDSPPRATASSGSPDAPSSPTESPTHSTTEHCPILACTSTTCAGCGDASAPSTSSPSPSARTCSEDRRPSPQSTQPRRTAATGTSSPTPTPTGRQTAAECAESACEPRIDAPTGERRASPPDGPGSVWTIPTQPLRVPAHLGIDHFAAFPMEFPRRIITGWSPAGVCTACGEGRRPVIRSTPVPASVKNPPGRASGMRDASRGDAAMTCSGQEMSRWKAANPDTITGYACACPEPTAPTTPAVVLDPFGGTGTTALVAKALGRHGISNDMSADYCRLATWRTNDEGELARAMQVDKPREQVHGQTSLLDLFDTDEATA